MLQIFWQIFPPNTSDLISGINCFLKDKILLQTFSSYIYITLSGVVTPQNLKKVMIMANRQATKILITFFDYDSTVKNETFFVKFMCS